MTVNELYAKFHIHRGLQLHQLRVASVAQIISDRRTDSVDKRTIVLAALFHDMGNILKSDMTSFVDLYEPEGVEFWKKIKEEFQSSYGHDEHVATAAIAHDIGLSRDIIAIIEGVGFSKITDTVIHGTSEMKIVAYADMRVGPYGILTIRERLEDIAKRYDHIGNSSDFETRRAMLDTLEKQALENTGLSFEDIHDATITAVTEELRNDPVLV